MPGNPIHKRQLAWCDSSSIEVIDTITADQSVRAISRLHLHPHCVIQEMREMEVTVKHLAGIFKIEVNGNCTIERESSWYCSEFGNRVQNDCLCIEAVGQELSLEYRIGLVV